MEKGNKSIYRTQRERVVFEPVEDRQRPSVFGSGEPTQSPWPIKTLEIHGGRVLPTKSSRIHNYASLDVIGETFNMLSPNILFQ